MTKAEALEAALLEIMMDDRRLGVLATVRGVELIQSSPGYWTVCNIGVNPRAKGLMFDSPTEALTDFLKCLGVSDGP